MSAPILSGCRAARRNVISQELLFRSYFLKGFWDQTVSVLFFFDEL